jgi:tetratricopeptide (TPR) repeat protein
MAHVAQRYPDDLDAATLYAEALFLLLPRPGAFDIANPDVAHLLSVLENALERDVRHSGACHLYVHTTELTNEPQRAAACAEHLGSAMPAASHLNHMPSHTWTRMGRWGDAVDASLRAWETDRKAPSGETIATYPAHDLQMLVLAACMDGQGTLAIRAAQGLTILTGEPMYHALALVRFGRFSEISALGQRPAADIPAAIWDFAQGYARLRSGDTRGARQFLMRVDATADSSRAAFRFHPARTLLGVLAGILDGEIERAERRLPDAIAAFERAVAMDDALVIDDPEPLPFAARHWLGAALIDARRFTDAERVYRADLSRHPHNGWSLVGLQQALRGQGKASREVDDDLRRSWARSDTTLRTSRF